MSPDHAELVTLAERLLATRSHRVDVLGALEFKDPTWDMLLFLYVAHFRGQRIDMTALCRASQVPFSTALRYVEALVEAGKIRRIRDEDDLRRSWVVTADHTVEQMSTLLREIRGKSEGAS